ncbi:uncharacterized protein LOC123313566 [Coccinella septempunctata]|uniref:uncharacterized protein LOC123313566 n=1 Tax=Coccinella septempunctata TaxID=41139 RepID=UPI001D066185|nr:uncharacterized protein LOC123313566 [Coccinella septempunctata]
MMLLSAVNHTAKFHRYPLECFHNTLSHLKNLLKGSYLNHDSTLSSPLPSPISSPQQDHTRFDYSSTVDPS